MRVEDLDPARSRAELALHNLDDLAWLGLDWDEGPDCGGPYPPYDQGASAELYDGALARLKAASRVYPCFCSRKDIAAAASAPQTPGDEIVYPGTCRELPVEETRRRLEAGRRHAWRFRVPASAPPFDDIVRGPWQSPATGDFVVQRSDGVAAYQLAVVVDDQRMLIDEVVRGDDLLSSTARQRMLFEALGHASPRFGHVPLLLGTDGARLSKRHQGITLRELRGAGFRPAEIVGRLADLLGLSPTPAAVPADTLIEGFDLARLSPAPEGIVVDVADWRPGSRGVE
jgi:glutamyl-tRNA synthetase